MFYNAFKKMNIKNIHKLIYITNSINFQKSSYTFCTYTTIMQFIETNIQIFICRRIATKAAHFI